MTSRGGSRRLLRRHFDTGDPGLDEALELALHSIDQDICFERLGAAAGSGAGAGPGGTGTGTGTGIGAGITGAGAGITGAGAGLTGAGITGTDITGTDISISAAAAGENEEDNEEDDDGLAAMNLSVGGLSLCSVDEDIAMSMGMGMSMGMNMGMNMGMGGLLLGDDLGGVIGEVGGGLEGGMGDDLFSEAIRQVGGAGPAGTDADADAADVTKATAAAAALLGMDDDFSVDGSVSGCREADAIPGTCDADLAASSPLSPDPNLAGYVFEDEGDVVGSRRKNHHQGCSPAADDMGMDVDGTDGERAAAKGTPSAPILAVAPPVPTFGDQSSETTQLPLPLRPTPAAPAAGKMCAGKADAPGTCSSSPASKAREEDLMAVEDERQHVQEALTDQVQHQNQIQHQPRLESSPRSQPVAAGNNQEQHSLEALPRSQPVRPPVPTKDVNSPQRSTEAPSGSQPALTVPPVQTAPENQRRRSNEARSSSRLPMHTAVGDEPPIENTAEGQHRPTSQSGVMLGSFCLGGGGAAARAAADSHGQRLQRAPSSSISSLKDRSSKERSRHYDITPQQDSNRLSGQRGDKAVDLQCIDGQDQDQRLRQARFLSPSSSLQDRSFPLGRTMHCDTSQGDVEESSKRRGTNASGLIHLQGQDQLLRQERSLSDRSSKGVLRKMDATPERHADLCPKDDTMTPANDAKKKSISRSTSLKTSQTTKPVAPCASLVNTTSDTASVITATSTSSHGSGSARSSGTPTKAKSKGRKAKQKRANSISGSGASASVPKKASALRKSRMKTGRSRSWTAPIITVPPQEHPAISGVSPLGSPIERYMRQVRVSTPTRNPAAIRRHHTVPAAIHPPVYQHHMYPASVDIMGAYGHSAPFGGHYATNISPPPPDYYHHHQATSPSPPPPPPGYFFHPHANPPPPHGPPSSAYHPSAQTVTPSSARPAHTPLPPPPHAPYPYRPSPLTPGSSIPRYNYDPTSHEDEDEDDVIREPPLVPGDVGICQSLTYCREITPTSKNGEHVCSPPANRMKSPIPPKVTECRKKSPLPPTITETRMRSPIPVSIAEIRMRSPSPIKITPIPPTVTVVSGEKRKEIVHCRCGRSYNVYKRERAHIEHLKSRNHRKWAESQKEDRAVS